MKNIFTGMIMVFIDFHLNIGLSRIGLIPTFLGYIFIHKGLAELAEFSPWFTKLMPYCKGMIVYTIITYVLDLLGIPPGTGIVLGIISGIVSFYISYGIIMGVMDIEKAKSQDLNSQQLYSTWKLMVISTLITHLLLIFPVLAIPSILIAFAISIYYLLMFNKTKKLFYEEYPTS